MISFFFTQQASNWQQFLCRSCSGGFFSRFFAWLILGLLMLVGLLVVVTVLLLSWLLIPVLLYKKHYAMQKMRAAGLVQPVYPGHAQYVHTASRGDVIEGMMKEVRDNDQR